MITTVHEHAKSADEKMDLIPNRSPRLRFVDGQGAEEFKGNQT